MKRILSTAMTAGFVLSLLSLASCASTKNAEDQENSQSVEVNTSDLEIQNTDNSAFTLRTPGEISGNAVQEYSHRTVIVSLEEGVSSEDVDLLAADFNLSVVYKYSIINACALTADRDLTDAELDDLIDRLEKDSRVLSVGKDYVYHLDGEAASVQE